MGLATADNNSKTNAINVGIPDFWTWRSNKDHITTKSWYFQTAKNTDPRSRKCFSMRVISGSFRKSDSISTTDLTNQFTAFGVLLKKVNQFFYKWSTYLMTAFYFSDSSCDLNPVPWLREYFDDSHRIWTAIVLLQLLGTKLGDTFIFLSKTHPHRVFLAQ